MFFGVLQGREVKPSHPAMFHSSRGVRGSLVPLLPPLALSERSRGHGSRGRGGGGGCGAGDRRRAAGPGGGEARELPGARASSARGTKRLRRQRAQGQGMTDAPSACAYVRESGRGRERARTPAALPSSLSLGSLLPPAPCFFSSPTSILSMLSLSLPFSQGSAGRGRPEAQVKSGDWISLKDQFWRPYD